MTCLGWKKKERKRLAAAAAVDALALVAEREQDEVMCLPAEWLSVVWAKCGYLGLAGWMQPCCSNILCSFAEAMFEDKEDQNMRQAAAIMKRKRKKSAFQLAAVF